MRRDNLDNGVDQSARRRRKRARETRTMAMLTGLVILTAVLYLAVSIFSWIGGRLETAGEGKGDPLVSGGDADTNETGEGNDNTGMAEAENGDDEEVVSVMSPNLVYSQEDLDNSTAAAREQGAADVLADIRSGLDGGETLLETLRPLYPDEMIVYSGGKYNFVPIDRSLRQSTLDEANLIILDTGEYQYQQDGQVISHKGIDVSRHQGTIDWNLVAQDGVEFAFIRVGYRGYGTGKMVEDDQFEANIQGALACGIKVGVYYYSQAITSEEVLEEANFVLEKIRPYNIECPVVFDVEKVSGEPGRMNDISVDDRTEFTRLFCETIKNAGYRPMIYHNTEMGAMMIRPELLEEYDKWFAAYNDTFYYPYEYKVWQYSQTGRVQGINGAVDLNISFAPLWEE